MTARSVRSPCRPGARSTRHGVALAGMGVGVGDYDADGWLDIVRTNFSEQVTMLYRNYGGAFEDASIKAGLGVNRKYVGFGVDFFDFDNDGWTRHLHRQRPRLLADRRPEAAPHVSAAAAALPQSRERPLRRRLGAGGTGNRRGESRPRLRLRRLRQRWRRRRLDQQPRRSADAAPQRWRQQEQLDPDQVRRHDDRTVRPSAPA